MRLINKDEQHLKRTVIVLLAIGMLGRIWTVAVYPPFGSAKVFILSLSAAVLLVGAFYAVNCINARSVSFLYYAWLRPVVPILTVSALLTFWAAAVYLFTDTLSLLRLGHFAMGTGLIVVVWFAVDSAFRVKQLMGVVVLGVATSALYGAAVTIFGDPFMTVWVILSKVDLERIPSIVAGGRMAGLSQNIIAFSYGLRRRGATRLRVSGVERSASRSKAANMVDLAAL